MIFLPLSQPFQRQAHTSRISAHHTPNPLLSQPHTHTRARTHTRGRGWVSAAMLIAVEGCGHGELDIIYQSLAEAEKQYGAKVDLLIICGDFQSMRDQQDLTSLACPEKYSRMGDFHEYYTGVKTAPVLTIFIGGNHEASNYLWELYYGGWAAHNIYYLGMTGVVHVNGITISGSSGIFKPGDYQKGFVERPPYTPGTQRSIYHVREYEVSKLRVWQGAFAERTGRHADVLLTHDWPRGVYNHGDKRGLVRRKKQFEDEVAANELGSIAGEELMNSLKPHYHFSGHLHCKFTALVRWGAGGDGEPQQQQEEEHATKFLALDKCLPGRRFLQVVNVESAGDATPSVDGAPDLTVYRDLDWLAVLKASAGVFPVGQHFCNMGQGKEAQIAAAVAEARGFVRARVEKDDGTLRTLRTPSGELLGVAAEAWDPAWATMERDFRATDHPQTAALCDFLGVENKIRSHQQRPGGRVGGGGSGGGGAGGAQGQVQSSLSSAKSLLDDLLGDVAAVPTQASQPAATVQRPVSQPAVVPAAAPVPQAEAEDEEEDGDVYRVFVG